MERKKDYILCVVSAVIGIVIFAVAGINKRITFCDEVYTYMIVNSSNAAYQFADGEWYTREQVTDMLAHTGTDSVVQMLRNVKGDPHPPLYYGLVYIASLIGGANLTRWTALSVNGLMYIGTIVMLWLAVYKAAGSSIAASVSALVYALNAGVISDAMLLRMYMQLSFFTIAFAYVTLLLYKDKDRMLYYVLLGIIAAGGFLTQYYFCFIAIFFFCVWLVYNLVKKSYKRIVKYLVSMVCAVAADTIVWHYWIGTLLSNNNSEAIRENALNFANLANSLFRGIMTVQLVLFQRWYIAGAVIALCIVAFTLLSKKAAQIFPEIRLYVGTLAIVVFLYAVVVYQLTPSYLMSGRYFYAAVCLELMLLAVCVSVLVRAYAPDKTMGKVAKSVAAVVCVAVDIIILVFGYGIDYYTDASEYDKQTEVLEEYANIPWVLCGDENWQLTANFFDYAIPEKIMRITDESEYREEPLLENADSFLVAARTNDENSGGDAALYYYIGCTGRFVRSELLMERNGVSYYVAYPDK